MTVPVRKAKQDLMHLGIELDDRLIERLQKNLKIDKIFHVAHEVSQVIKTNPKLPTGSVEEMSFRYVSPDLELENSKHLPRSINPFQKELFQLDSKIPVSLLRRLEDRSINIDPQHRPHIDRMIESFQIQYSRSSEKFVGRLLGQKWTLQQKRNPDLIARSILQHRYVNKDDFKAMIRRVYTENGAKPMEDDILNSLFKILAEDKLFGTTKARAVVDLWSFLTLIKAATDQSRRSYDSRTSQLANDVEFWNKANNFPVSDTFFSRDDAAVKNEAPRREPNKERPQSAPRVRTRQVNVNAKSVAETLGQADYTSHSQQDKGRRVMGRFQAELRDGSDVPSALNSKLVSSRPTSPMKSHNWWVKDCDVHMAPPENMLDSTKVAYLLGQANENQLKAKEGDRSDKRKTTGNYFMREMMNKASISHVLGKGGEDFRAQGSELNNAVYVSPVKSKKDSPARTGGKIGLRSFGTELSREVNNNDYYFDKTHQSKVHNKRKKLKDTLQLHWNDIKTIQQERPSVATALRME